MKILVPVDGSKSALNAVKYAAKLSANLRSNDTITLLTVHDDQGLRHAKQFVGKAEVDDYLRELSDKELKTSLADLLIGSVAQRVVAACKKPVVLVK